MKRIYSLLTLLFLFEISFCQSPSEWQSIIDNYSISDNLHQKLDKKLEPKKNNGTFKIDTIYNLQDNYFLSLNAPSDYWEKIFLILLNKDFEELDIKFYGLSY